MKTFFPSSAIAKIAHANQQSNSRGGSGVTLFRNLNDLIPDRWAFEVIARGIAESATESESATTPEWILLYRVTHHVTL